MDSYDGKVCYCIEPGVPRNVGDSYSGFGENFWDNYPSQYNNTIEPDDIKVLLGRIMQYGYQGNIPDYMFRNILRQYAGKEDMKHFSCCQSKTERKVKSCTEPTE